jgi:hypothetical protein
VNVKSTTNGATALHMASMEGHTEVVKLLLEKGADVNAKRNDGVTALYLAEQEGHTDTMQALLDNGAEEKKGALIKGILLSSNNEPMKGVKFFLLNIPFETEDLKRKKIKEEFLFLPLADKTLTNDEGKFFFKGVPVGNYFISAAISKKNAGPGDFVKSGGNKLVIVVKGENETFNLKIQSGNDLRSLDN